MAVTAAAMSPATMLAAAVTMRRPAEVWKVFAYDINANTRICEVPAQGLKFGRRVNDAGPIDLSVNLTDPKARAQLAPLIPYFDVAPFALYVERNGTLEWGGWATTTKYTHSSAAAFPISGKEWLDYFAQRVVQGDYSSTTYPAPGVDPAALIVTAVTDAQDPSKAGPGASVGISVVRSPATSSGLTWITPSYTSTDFVSQVIADMVAGTTPGSGGVDVWTEVQWSAPDAQGQRSPKVTMHVVSPRSGRVAGYAGAGSGLTLELTSAVDFTWPVDFAQAGTTFVETGGGSGQVAPQVTVQAPGVPVGGLGQPPRLDKVIQRTNVLDRALLTAAANGDAQTFAPPVTTPTVLLRTDDPATPFGSWIVGDDARLRVAAGKVDRFPNGLDTYLRIVADDVTVSDAGVSTVQLTLNDPPTY